MKSYKICCEKSKQNSENKKIYSWTFKSKWSGIQTSLNIKLINKKVNIRI